MSDPGTIIKVLEEIRDELETEYPHHARLAEKLAVTARSDWSSAASMYCSGDWWGGSGSVFDLSPANSDQRRRLATLLVALIERFDEAGVRCPRAISAADTLRGWLSSGLL